MRSPNTEAASQDPWPSLPYEAWSDTYATLHMWSQIVGKVALAQAAPLNHCWAVALHLTARGLRTGILPHGDRSFTIEFDFIDHQLVIDTSDGVRRSLPLAPRSVATFYAEVMATLDEMGLPVRIWSTPVEIPSPIPFERDTGHHSYDPEYVQRFWRLLARVHRVFAASRCGFIGKSSPAHFFWGSFDLAVTRFSGRPAPPREGPAFMRDAYSHEVISHGFWPGSGPVLEPAFYAYAVPEPLGLKTSRVQPEGAFYHPELNEFILPYEAVRRAASPETAIAAFLDSTYDRAATLAGWDRPLLERPMDRT
ncbi:MAG TPA: DUF5996 family protein [Vicinamibacterales bacterium]|nr:DUF5996 family protein [Vicinamibacterales bacterium]